MQERWKDILGYESRYEISNKGRVRRKARSISTGAFLKDYILLPKLEKSGYYRVTLFSENKAKSFFIHRLVAMMFVDGYKEGYVVNHKDENKTNNIADNLEWVSPKQNTNYGTAIQRRSISRCKPIIQYSIDGQMIQQFASAKEIEQVLGFDHRSISLCCNGKLESINGYKWEFAPQENKENTSNIVPSEQPREKFVDIEGEIWREVNIEGELFPNYEVSNLGRIRTVPHKGYSKSYKLCHPYYVRGRAQMTLRREKKRFKTSVARIVAFAFCKGYKKGYQANHIDENPLNDKATNLEWLSCKDNINYGKRTKKAIKKLCIKVAQIDLEGNVIRIFPSINEACREVGGRIKQVCEGKQETANGYRWMYV